MSQGRLLVVDDDRDFAESLAEVLELAGHSVELAFSGDEAIDKCRSSEYDMALMDVRMPGKNGVDSFLEIRRERPDFRAIMMTGFSVPGLLERALDGGAWRVMRKPIELSVLLELVDRACAGAVVVVADDDPDLVESLRALLEEAGHRAVVALDGESAVDRVLSVQPDVLILDLRLPRRSGLEVYQELERLGKVVPTIVISAYLTEEAGAVRELESRNVARILAKPFDSYELLSIMEAVVV